MAMKQWRRSAAATVPDNEVVESPPLPSREAAPNEDTDEYDEDAEESVRYQSEYVLFDDEDDDGDTGVDDDDTKQQDGESSDDYETRLNSIAPPSMHFCCQPAFS